MGTQNVLVCQQPYYAWFPGLRKHLLFSAIPRELCCMFFEGICSYWLPRSQAWRSVRTVWLCSRRSMQLQRSHVLIESPLIWKVKALWYGLSSCKPPLLFRPVECYLSWGSDYSPSAMPAVWGHNQSLLSILLYTRMEPCATGFMQDRPAPRTSCMIMACIIS